MVLERLPFHMLLALGFLDACGTDACLSTNGTAITTPGPITTVTTSATTDSGTSTTGTGTTGTTTTGTGTGSGTGSDTGTSTGTASDTGTSGYASREDVLQRVGAKLPADVRQRLCE